ncbi:hypothetical protein AWB82_02539 [Caballeronia glebae]|uniref:Uncharacterized protein n=1 Tax=Caballeronia glebae TaxID=1777143 RepID=A0A158ALF4_9BURK|nr:hypothetical protein AWB82_02539 [Caballeronia glebae]
MSCCASRMLLRETSVGCAVSTGTISASPKNFSSNLRVALMFLCSRMRSMAYAMVPGCEPEPASA